MTLELTDEVLRLAGAAAAGGIIGINRDIANKPIGLRTLALVSLGAAIATVAAIQVPGRRAPRCAESRRAGRDPGHHDRDQLHRCRRRCATRGPEPSRA